MAGTGNGNRKTGTQYEVLAASYLQGLGFEILQHNFSSRFGEIDLIAKEGKYLVFVEVKYRATDSGGHPLEAVDVRKQRRIIKTAEFYLLRYGFAEDTPCRFDVVGIIGEEICHVRNAFEKS